MRLNAELRHRYRELADQYRQATGEAEYEVHEVVAWALAAGQLELSPAEVEEIHCLRLSESLRSDTIRDQHGRKVRVRHCIVTREQGAEGPQQRTLWAHIDDARDEFLVDALLQRRERIRADADSLRADLDYINARRAHRGLRPIQMSFDFNAAA